MQLIVLGMHCSGTSMLTRLINMMGAYVGPENALLDSDECNPKGYWERRDVIRVNDDILLQHDCKWYMLADWVSELPFVPPQPLALAMRSIVTDMDAFRPWVMKDPRLCFTLPWWQPYLEVPVAVIVYRDPFEIVRSLYQRDTLGPAYSLSLWEYHAVGALNASQEMPRLFIRHDQMIANPVETVSHLLAELEAPGVGVPGLIMPSEREINAFIDLRLYRARRGNSEAPLSLSPEQQTLAAMMSGELRQSGKLEVSAGSLETMARAKAFQEKAVKSIRRERNPAGARNVKPLA